MGELEVRSLCAASMCLTAFALRGDSGTSTGRRGDGGVCTIVDRSYDPLRCRWARWAGGGEEGAKGQV